MSGLDDRDRLILNILQNDAATPVAEIAGRASLSLSACARRIKALEEDGFVAGRVALLNRRALNLPTTIFVAIRNARHSPDWHEPFTRLLACIPEIVEAHRLTGDIDYILKIVAPNVEAYDDIYKVMTRKLELFGVSAYISMETLKSTTVLPVGYAR